MKHLFILNPMALKKENKNFTERLYRECDGLDFEIYLTKSAEDGPRKAKEAAETGEELCIYAGGGDGVIQQIAEAIYPYKNVILSVIPLGTGNDFIRNFGSKKDFLTLRHIRNGQTKTIDLIRINDRICANMINIGFDESVVERVDRLRKFPLMNKSIAYTVGVLIQLVQYPKENLHITADNGAEYNGECLLTFIANGQYCGGGYRAASLASIDDGIMDMLIVHPLPRRKFIAMVGDYKKGTLLGTKKAEKVAEFHKVKKVTIEKNAPFHVCLDGEIVTFQKLEIEILPKAIRFKYPKEN